jgi:hypothetical protein
MFSIFSVGDMNNTDLVYYVLMLLLSFYLACCSSNLTLPYIKIQKEGKSIIYYIWFLSLKLIRMTSFHFKPSLVQLVEE